MKQGIDACVFYNINSRTGNPEEEAITTKN